MFLAGLDNILIYIKPETLKKLNVKHVLMGRGYIQQMKSEGIKWPKDFSLHKEFEQDNFLVYSTQQK